MSLSELDKFNDELDKHIAQMSDRDIRLLARIGLKFTMGYAIEKACKTLNAFLIKG